MAWPLDAIYQVREDITSIFSFLSRVWNTRDDLSSRAKAIYTCLIIVCPLGALLTLPWFFGVPTAIFILLIFDGFGFAMRKRKGIVDAKWERI